ncbi:proline-rich receptor-like protein kinase PERK14 [Equus quagga]|uniref:proline-rich receptor-like protein kinase PERK14 n=1 Tax=Equus quagga TaxID=89248 RepID=UPI001EE2F560|nr:proline-rich receptor-like protein kinase PERK14 [Equus quagga]
MASACAAPPPPLTPAPPPSSPFSRRPPDCAAAIPEGALPLRARPALCALPLRAPPQRGLAARECLTPAAAASPAADLRPTAAERCQKRERILMSCEMTKNQAAEGKRRNNGFDELKSLQAGS